MGTTELPTHPPARRMPARRSAALPEPPNRKLAILLAAEKLFGQRGYHGVSIRDIASEAGVPLALVGYHFGAKHQLYHAIFASWLPSINDRLARLNAAMADPAAPGALGRVLEAFIAPLIALHGSPEGQHFAVMAARDLSRPSAPEVDEVQREYFDPMAHAFIDALARLHPQQSRGQVAWCYQFMLGAVLHFLSDERVARLSHGQNTPADPACQPTLLRFVAAGFQAVLGAAAPEGPAPASRAPVSPAPAAAPLRPPANKPSRRRP